MSRAFVREDDLESRGEFEGPERPLPPEPVLVTAAGRRALEARLAQLGTLEAELSQGAALAAESARQALQRERRWLEAVLAAAVTPAPAVGGPAGFGASVTVEDEEGARRTYRLVGEVEADPKAGAISWRSPLGGALMEAAVGDSVTWQRPAGETELAVVAVGWEEVEG